MGKGITQQELDHSLSSRIIIRDNEGRAKLAPPATADDIAIKSTVDNAVGPLASLLTTEKSNTVAAINELFTNVSDGKNMVASAITGKGVPASGSETFPVLAGKIEKIVTGKRFVAKTATSDDTQRAFYYRVGAGAYMYPITIDYNFGFVPSFVIVTELNSNTPAAFYYSGVLASGTTYGAFNTYSSSIGGWVSFFTQAVPNDPGNSIAYTIVNSTKLYVPINSKSYNFQFYVFE